MKRVKLVSRGGKFVRTVLIIVVGVLLSSFAMANPTPVPKDALKALQIAKGRPCRKGLVFMDGRYIPPPYVVKRYGTAIMINDIQVTAPLIAWEDFIKTQSGVKVSKSEVAAPAVAEEPEEPEEAVEEDDDDDPLADLFDDEPKPKKKAAKKSAYKRKPPKPTVTTTYTLEGDFVMNDASKALLARINNLRTDINAKLLNEGFFFFGSNYPRVSGESREAKRLLANLPAIMKQSQSASDVLTLARRNGFGYITESIAEGLFRNRHTYTQLEQRSRRENGDDIMNLIRK